MKCMLDSGAFSAFNRGVDIDIDEYAEFVLKNQNLFDVCINLDVLGDGHASYNNWKYLISKGINTIPVYHIGSDEKFLKKYLRECDYICLGAIAKLHTGARLKGLSYIWKKYLLNDQDFPKIKVHGLGLTSTLIMRMFPWYSVDSKSWIDYASYGQVIYPPLKNGRWSYKHSFLTQRMSLKSNKSFNKLSMYNIDKDAVTRINFNKYIEHKANMLHYFGTSTDTIIEKLCYDFKFRCEFNAMYYVDLAQTLPKWPWKVITLDNIDKPIL